MVFASTSGVARSIPIAESVPLPNGYPGPSALAHVLSLVGAAQADQRPIKIPALGLTLFVRLSPDVFGGAASIIETVHAPGFGPPLHRHAETEVFRVLRGRYVMQMDDKLIELAEGDLVTVPGGVAHAFVNVSEEQSSQLVLITPGMQADVFFGELSQLMRKRPPERTALDAFGHKWGVEFLGPPLRADVVRARF